MIRSEVVISASDKKIFKNSWLSRIGGGQGKIFSRLASRIMRQRVTLPNQMLFLLIKLVYISSGDRSSVTFLICLAVLRSRNRNRSQWSRNYLRPGTGAGAEIIFLTNIYCSQFGGCKDEEKPNISYGTTVILQF